MSTPIWFGSPVDSENIGVYSSSLNPDVVLVGSEKVCVGSSLAHLSLAGIIVGVDDVSAGVEFSVVFVGHADVSEDCSVGSVGPAVGVDSEYDIVGGVIPCVDSVIVSVDPLVATVGAVTSVLTPIPSQPSAGPVV